MKVLVVSGFLGASKTTLDGSKMALIGEGLDIPGIGMALLEFRMPSAPETGASGAGEHGKIRIEKS